MPSSDIQSHETSAQNTQGKKVTCSNFNGFIFCGSYFRVLVVGCENCESLDLAKISCYTVFQIVFLICAHFSGLEMLLVV